MPRPTAPLEFTPLTIKAGVVEPWLPMTKEVSRTPISTESLPHGVEEPMPMSPTGEERVETEKIGGFAVEVETEKTLSALLPTILVTLPVLEMVKRFA